MMVAWFFATALAKAHVIMAIKSELVVFTAYER